MRQPMLDRLYKQLRLKGATFGLTPHAIYMERRWPEHGWVVHVEMEKPNWFREDWQPDDAVYRSIVEELEIALMQKEEEFGITGVWRQG